MTDQLAERTITWPDTTTETVRIDDNGWFYLNGVKKRMLGFHWGIGIWHPDSVWDCSTSVTTFWTPQATLDYLEAQLSYMATNGIRVIRMIIPYTFLASTTDEANAYRALFDLIREYKMFFIPHPCAKWFEGFTCEGTTSEFVIPDGTNSDTLATWLARVNTVFTEYDNIVAVNCDNELDLWYNSGYYGVSQDYTPQNAVDHLTWMKTVFAGLGVPLIHNLAADITSTSYDSVLLPLSDIPAFDTYKYTSREIRNNLLARMTTLGVTGNFWVVELNKGQGWADPYVDASRFNWHFVNECFVAGASLVLILSFQHYYWDDASQAYGYGFYNWDNTPKPALTALLTHQEFLQKYGTLIA